MCRQDHPDADLANVPGDMVTDFFGLRLDPDITMDNAQYQLDRVASKWATELERDPAQVRSEINAIIQTMRMRR